MIHLRENRCLHQLCVDERRLHREDRLIRIHDAALPQRPHGATEAEIPQPVEKILRIDMKRAKVRDVRIIEVHPLEVVQHLLKPREDRKARTIWILPVEHVEGHQVLRPRILEITVRHRHLIEIHHHGNIPLITLIHIKSFLSQMPCCFRATRDLLFQFLFAKLLSYCTFTWQLRITSGSIIRSCRDRRSSSRSSLPSEYRNCPVFTIEFQIDCPVFCKLFIL